MLITFIFFFFQAEDGIRDKLVTGVQTCALPIFEGRGNGSTWTFLGSCAVPPRPCRRIVPVPVTLRREPTNEKDANAIAAEVERHHVGYMTAPLAARIAPAMDGLGLVSITVAALGARRTGRGSPAGSSGQ